MRVDKIVDGRRGRSIHVGWEDISSNDDLLIGVNGADSRSERGAECCEGPRSTLFRIKVDEFGGSVKSVLNTHVLHAERDRAGQPAGDG